MEEAPKGTFEDELDWCIQQLETGLLHRNPTPRQVEDTQRVLRVLRSRKAPFVKKRQMMNQVFGNYRLKMAEERQKQEQAAKNLPEPKIQEVTSRDNQSVVYRKSAKDGQSGAGHWFTPSSSEFNFNFFPDQECQNTEAGPDSGEEDHAKEVTSTKSLQDTASCLGSGSEFTFNFQIKEEQCSTSESSAAPPTTQDASGEHLGANNMAQAVAQQSLSQDCSSLDNAASTSTEAIDKGTAESQKKKKKKKKKSKAKNVVAQTQSKVEERSGNVDPSPSQKEEPKSGADDLRRELDWCVEQFEIGLQREKFTPRQVEETLRARKTLRSEKVPLVKKRQLMRLMFGDYRQKMEVERIKQLRLMQIAAKSAKITEVTRTARQKRSKVFRHSSHRSSRSATSSSTTPAGTQESSNLTTASSSSSGLQEFTFRPSQEAFCFNFF